MTIISDLSDLEISQVSVTIYVMITARVASPTAPCPCCGTVSKRVHSQTQVEFAAAKILAKACISEAFLNRSLFPPSDN